MITAFRGEHDFLSNFHGSPAMYEGVVYDTAEHAYQAAKERDPWRREAIRLARSPGLAKFLGKLAELPPDWDERRVAVMAQVLRTKFYGSEEMGRRLLATGTEFLVEGNTWGDRFWGAQLVGGEWVGENQLGHLLMALRQKMRLRLERQGVG